MKRKVTDYPDEKGLKREVPWGAESMKFCSSRVDEDEVEGQFGVEPNMGRDDEAPKVATVGDRAVDEDGEVMRDGMTRLRR